MNGIEIEALPYDEQEVLNLLVSASSSYFSGFAEIYISPSSLVDFGTALMAFPADLNHKVIFEQGNGSGEFAYHLLLRAEVIDQTGHSALFVRTQSFFSAPSSGLAEFFIAAEPASINEFGRALVSWANKPTERFLWQAKA